MEELDSIEYIWLKDFAEQNWHTFIEFMEERQGESGMEDAEALMEKLGKLGGE